METDGSATSPGFSATYVNYDAMDDEGVVAGGFINTQNWWNSYQCKLQTTFPTIHACVAVLGDSYGK